MSRVQDPNAELVLALPPIALSELREPTKDYLLAKANAGHAPVQTLKELLDRGAERERGAGEGGVRGRGSEVREEPDQSC